MPDPAIHPTPREWAEALASTRRRMMQERPRAFPPGARRKCPSCGRTALVSRDDLVRETITDGLLVMHHNLHGGQCTQCGHEYLEGYEEVALEEAAGLGFMSDYRASVTRVAGSHLGTYWPKDVVRNMGLATHDELSVKVLGKDRMLIERMPPGGPGPSMDTPPLRSRRRP